MRLPRLVSTSLAVTREKQYNVYRITLNTKIRKRFFFCFFFNVRRKTYDAKRKVYNVKSKDKKKM